MLMTRHEPEQACVGIQSAPLAGVALALVAAVILMVRTITTTGYLTGTNAGPEPVDVPTLNVELRANGDIVADGLSLRKDEWVVPLAEATLTNRPGLRATIHCEASVTQARVIRVLDFLKGAGIDKVSVHVRRSGTLVP